MRLSRCPLAFREAGVKTDPFEQSLMAAKNRVSVERALPNGIQDAMEVAKCA
jgi:hypothetical protein